MTAFNVVRMRVKPGMEKKYIAAHRKIPAEYPGLKSLTLIKTGENSYCIVGEWSSFKTIVAARPKMVGTLDGIRHMLEDLGGGLGVTDPVSGEAVLTIKAKKKAKKSKKKAAKKAAKKSKAKAKKSDGKKAKKNKKKKSK
jgi:hypothetical protein